MYKYLLFQLAQDHNEFTLAKHLHDKRDSFNLISPAQFVLVVTTQLAFCGIVNRARFSTPCTY